MSAPQVDALLKLITQSAQQAVAVYAKHSDQPPTLAESHPFDSSIDLELKKTIRILEGACEQLCSTLAPAYHTLSNVSQIPVHWSHMGR